MKIEWARSVKEQCVSANVPLFYKQGPGDDGIVRSMPLLDGRVWDQRPMKGSYA
jgi:protein gp37